MNTYFEEPSCISEIFSKNNKRIIDDSDQETNDATSCSSSTPNKNFRKSPVQLGVNLEIEFTFIKIHKNIFV